MRIRRALIHLALHLARRDAPASQRIGHPGSRRLTAPCTACCQECILLCQQCVERMLGPKVPDSDSPTLATVMQLASEDVELAGTLGFFFGALSGNTNAKHIIAMLLEEK